MLKKHPPPPPTHPQMVTFGVFHPEKSNVGCVLGGQVLHRLWQLELKDIKRQQKGCSGRSAGSKRLESAEGGGCGSKKSKPEGWKMHRSHPTSGFVEVRGGILPPHLWVDAGRWHPRSPAWHSSCPREHLHISWLCFCKALTGTILPDLVRRCQLTEEGCSCVSVSIFKRGERERGRRETFQVAEGRSRAWR